MKILRLSEVPVLTLICIAVLATVLSGSVRGGEPFTLLRPEDGGLDSNRLEALWGDLQRLDTKAFLVARHGKTVFEGYAPDFTRHTPHGTASLAKAMVGGVSLMLAMDDGVIRPDDLASQFVASWNEDPLKARIRIRHLATHTSGIEDAEADNLAHDKLSGWKGDFWKRLPPPRDPFSISRDIAPVLEPPGARARYSNPGMAMLSYCLTASLRATKYPDLRTLLKERIMDPLGVPQKEWSVGYSAPTTVDGMTLVATWGGATVSPDAAFRLGQMLLQKGKWEGRQLISPAVVATATTNAHLPNNSGLGWWVNHELDGSNHWSDLPRDGFWGAGAGHQFLLIVPSLDLVVVRLGGVLERNVAFDRALETHLVQPLMGAFRRTEPALHKPSPVIEQIQWAPAESIVRKAHDSDIWPLTWADDDTQYTAYGDGRGFEPFVPEKLSMGFARIDGGPSDFAGMNIRSPTGERKGDGRNGLKASGILMVDKALYLWVRNATNSQLAWSKDHGQSWAWSEWKFTTSFGCPTFLNFGKNYAGARDDFVYVYSPNNSSAYEAADRFVLGRVPRNQITNRLAYEFLERVAEDGTPTWTEQIADRGAVFESASKCYRSNVTYNTGLKRYLWCQTLPGGDARFEGGFAVYDAPEPWGPWTEVFYTERWDVGPGESSSFPTRWMSPDGKVVWLVFSGQDSFSTRRAELILTSRVP
jgi:CubicO group peptidase (beta-lactamase class C family)